MRMNNFVKIRKMHVLILGCLLFNSIAPMNVLGKTLHEEKNGFKWYEIYNRYESGPKAESIDGKLLVGYSKEIHFKIVDGNDEGAFIALTYSRNIHGHIYSVYSRDGRCLIGREYNYEYIERKRFGEKYFFECRKRLLGAGAPIYHDSNGNMTFQNINGAIEDIKDGYIYVISSGYKSVYNMDGDVIVPSDHYNKVERIRDWFYADKSYDGTFLYDTIGNLILKTGEIKFKNDIIVLYRWRTSVSDEISGIMDIRGKWILPNEKYENIKIKSRDSSYCYAVQNRDGYWGLADSLGNEIFAPEFDDIDYIGGDFVKFKIGDYWGVMKFDGTTIIPTSRGYTSIGRYVRSQNVISFEKNGVNGECDSTGKELTIIGSKKPQSSKIRQKKTTATKSTSAKNTTSAKTSSPKINPIFTNLHGEESYKLLYIMKGYTKNNGTISVKEKEWVTYDEKTLNNLGVELKLDNHILSSTTMYYDSNAFFPKITLTGKPILNSKGAYEYPYKCGNYVGKALLCPDKKGNLLFTYVSEVNSGTEKRYFICIKK